VRKNGLYLSQVSNFAENRASNVRTITVWCEVRRSRRDENPNILSVWDDYSARGRDRVLVLKYAYQLNPPDFHTCIECHVGGYWLVLEATRRAPLNGLVRIGTGRDAADASTESIFGQVQLTAINVSCQLVPGQTFTAVAREQQNRKAISLETSHVTTSN
jgi:hypothetical protein